MTVEKVKEVLGAEICTSVPYDHLDIKVACGSDLMSDALAFGDDKGLLLTGLNNPQCIRTAEMMDIHCVVLVRGKEPDHGLVSLANEKGIVVLTCGHSMYNSCGMLYEAGLKGEEI